MPLNTRALKKLNTLPDDPEFIIGIEGKDVPVKVGVTAAKTALGVTALEVSVAALPTTPTETIVNITSAQILAMGTTPVELLPASGVNSYYEIDKVIIEYTHVTTGYTFDDEVVLQINSNTKFIRQILGGTSTWLVISDLNGTETSSSIPVGSPIVPAYGEGLNKGLTINTYNGTDPTLGDGTLRAIITYTLRTFGA